MSLIQATITSRTTTSTNHPKVTDSYDIHEAWQHHQSITLRNLAGDLETTIKFPSFNEFLKFRNLLARIPVAPPPPPPREANPLPPIDDAWKAKSVPTTEQPWFSSSDGNTISNIRRLIPYIFSISKSPERPGLLTVQTTDQLTWTFDGTEADTLLELICEQRPLGQKVKDLFSKTPTIADLTAEVALRPDDHPQVDETWRAYTDQCGAFLGVGSDYDKPMLPGPRVFLVFYTKPSTTPQYALNEPGPLAVITMKLAGIRELYQLLGTIIDKHG